MSNDVASDTATAVAIVNIDDYSQVDLTMSQKAISFLPLGILAFATTTIVAAYKVTFASGVLDFQHGRVTTPPISMLMFAGPGRIMGQIGFPAVSALFGFVGPTFFQHLSQAITYVNGSERRHTFLQWSLKGTSLIGFLCLAIVGIIPLQEDLELVIKRQIPIRWDSILHQSAAGVFFFCGILHMGLWLALTMTCHPTLPIHYTQSPKSFRLKLLCFFLCFFPLPTAFLLHPISPIRKKLSLNSQDAGGITQYALVACVSTFFASYSCELWSLQQFTQRITQMQKQIKEATAKVAVETKKSK